MRVAAPLLVALLVALLVGCLEPIAPDEVEIGLVRVTVGSAGAETDTIQVRSTTRAHATAYAREGYDAGLTRFVFASSDTLVATVDSFGTVRGVSPGEAIITATAPQGASGSATVVVLPSTIAYTIPLGGAPGAITFSTDFARAYVATTPDSVVVLDALGFFRVAAVGVGHPVGDVAATASRLFATHPGVDSVTVVATATNRVTSRIWVGAGPHAIVATGQRAFVAARWDHRIVTIEGEAPRDAIPVGGEPAVLALAADGSRLFAGVKRSGAWRLVLVDPQFPDTVGSVALNGEPTAIATDARGERVWVLRGDAGRVDAYRVAADGAFTLDGSVAVGSGARGIAARPVGPVYVVVSGARTVVLDGLGMAVLDAIPGAGGGHAVVRPDGLFAFLGAPGAGAVHVIRM